MAQQKMQQRLAHMALCRCMHGCCHAQHFSSPVHAEDCSEMCKPQSRLTALTRVLGLPQVQSGSNAVRLRIIRRPSVERNRNPSDEPVSPAEDQTPAATAGDSASRAAE